MTILTKFSIIVFSILITSTIIYLIIKRFLNENLRKELRDRILTWWYIVVVAFIIFYLKPKLSIILLGFISFWALKEYYTILKTRREDHLALFFAFFFFAPVQYWWIWTGWYGMFLIFIPVYAFISIPFLLLISRQPKGFSTSAAEIHWGLMAFVYGFSHLAYLINLKSEINPNSPITGFTLMLFFLFIVEMSDVFQYIFGKLFGRHKIWPNISPGKTWEGLILGIIATTIVSIFVRFLTPFDILDTIKITILVCVVGFVGGGVMSAIKRDLGTKDFGNILPGHGGVIDRIDSICWSAPIFFHYVRYYYHYSWPLPS